MRIFSPFKIIDSINNRINTKLYVAEVENFKCSSNKEINEDTRTENDKFSFILDALDEYKNAYGHLLIPASYRIPSPSDDDNDNSELLKLFSSKYYGLRLGHRVAKLRARKRFQENPPLNDAEISILDSKEFIWDVSLYKFNSFLSLLKIYKQQYCSCDDKGSEDMCLSKMPISYQVPKPNLDEVSSSTSIWPRWSWGYKLGLRVHSAKKKKIFKKPIQILQLKHVGLYNYRSCGSSRSSSIDLDWMYSHKPPTPNDVMNIVPLLVLFKQIYQTCNVPIAYVIDPSHDHRWPEETNQIQLGKIVQELRKYINSTSSSTCNDINNNNERSKQNLSASSAISATSALLKAGLLMDSVTAREHSVLSALQHFYRKRGHLNVPQRFKISHDVVNLKMTKLTNSINSNTADKINDKYPIQCLNLHLGREVSAIRSNDWEITPHMRKWLDIHSFDWIDSRRRDFSLVCDALLVHQELFGDMLVPRYFKVPAEEPWPLKSWGMHLGNRVRNIRTGTAYTQQQHHDLLHSIGFYSDINTEVDVLQDYLH